MARYVDKAMIPDQWSHLIMSADKCKYFRPQYLVIIGYFFNFFLRHYIYSHQIHLCQECFCYCIVCADLYDCVVWLRV